jgi:hypothetical protein
MNTEFIEAVKNLTDYANKFLGAVKLHGFSGSSDTDIGKASIVLEQAIEQVATMLSHQNPAYLMNDDGTFTLLDEDDAPEADEAFFKELFPEILKGIKRGLEQSAEGKVKSLGDFSQYANEGE